MKTIAFFTLIFSLFVFASCDLPPPMDGKGIVTISFGGGGNGRAAINPTDPVPPSWGYGENLKWGQVTFSIKMSGGLGREPKPKRIRYNESAQFALVPGIWDIFVSVYGYDDNGVAPPLFEGSLLGVDIKAGPNVIDDPIEMKPLPGALLVRVPEKDVTFSPLQGFDIIVEVRGFLKDSDAKDFQLTMENVNNADPEDSADPQNMHYFVSVSENHEPAVKGTKIFHVTGDWYRNEIESVPPYATYHVYFELEIPDGFEDAYHPHESVKFNSVDVTIADGESYNYPIPVNQGNIDDFISYVQANDINLSKHYKLETNIDLAGKTWTPIGTSEHPFWGTFNGNGKKISGLSITGSGDVGLFGFVKNISGYDKGFVKNIWLDNCTITGTGAGNVGGIAGFIQVGDPVNITTVENCFISGSITGQGNVGGVVGQSIGGTIKNCYTDVTVAAIVGVKDAATTLTNNYGLNEVPPSDQNKNKTFWAAKGFKFGTNEDNPWKWSSKKKLPILWFVKE